MASKSINRTVAVAWAPSSQYSSLIATGTLAGALDDTFSTTAELEIHDLMLGDRHNTNASCRATIPSPARFNRLVWSQLSNVSSEGILAGGLEDGSICLWNVRSILEGNTSEALIYRKECHSGPVRALQFNPFNHHYLVSGSTDAEILLSDANDPSKTQAPGQGKSQSLEDVTALAWNCKVAHILAASSNNGCVVIWDLRHKREVIKLSSAGKFSISSLCWNPENATQIITACEDDSNPVINCWDLRNAHAPEKTLTGHSKGILSIAWCPKDTELLISGAKDNKAICWNPIKGTKISELYHGNNWIFDVQWSPCNPDLFSTASFDGYINVFSFQGVSTQGGVVHASQATESAFQEAFGIQEKNGKTAIPSSSLSSNMAMGQGTMPLSGSLAMASGANVQAQQQSKQPTQIPKWLRPVIGASFGFGGQLVYFNNKGGVGSGGRSVSISRVSCSETDALVKRITELDVALSTGNFEDFCNQRIEKTITTISCSSSSDLESTFWTVAKILASGRGGTTTAAAGGDQQIPQKLLQLLGYDQINLTEQLGNMSLSITSAVNKTPPILQESFSNDHLEEDDEKGNSLNAENPSSSNSNGNERPFSLFPKNSSEAERMITKSVIKRDFEEAVNICIGSGKLSDALLISICGGQELIAKTQQLYLKKASSPYIRIVAGVIKDDMSDVVQNAALDNWEQILALICSFSGLGDKFKSMCNILARRLEEQEGIDVLPAILCYFAARNFERASLLLVTHLTSSNLEEMNYFAKTAWYCSFVEKLRIAEFICQAPNRSASIPKVNEIYFEYAQRASNLGLNAIAAKYVNSISSQIDDPEMKLFAYKLRNLLPSTVKMNEIPRPFEMIQVGGMVKPMVEKTISSDPSASNLASNFSNPQRYQNPQQQQHQMLQSGNVQMMRPPPSIPLGTLNSTLASTASTLQYPSAYGMGMTGMPPQSSIPSNPYSQQPIPPSNSPTSTMAGGIKPSQPLKQQHSSNPYANAPHPSMMNGGNIQQSAPLYPPPPPSHPPPSSSSSNFQSFNSPLMSNSNPPLQSFPSNIADDASGGNSGSGNLGKGAMGMPTSMSSIHSPPLASSQMNQMMPPPPPINASGIQSMPSMQMGMSGGYHSANTFLPGNAMPIPPPHVNVPSIQNPPLMTASSPPPINTNSMASQPPFPTSSSSAPFMTEAKGGMESMMMNGDKYPIPPPSFNNEAFGGGSNSNSNSGGYQPQTLSPTSAHGHHSFNPSMTNGTSSYGNQMSQSHLQSSQQRMGANIGGGMVASSAPSAPSMNPYSSVSNIGDNASLVHGRNMSSSMSNVPSMATNASASTATATLLQPINPNLSSMGNVPSSISPSSPSSDSMPMVSSTLGMGAGSIPASQNPSQISPPSASVAFNPSDISMELQPLYKSFNDLVTTCQQRAMPMQRRIVDDATKKITILYQQLAKGELGSTVLDLIKEMCNGINSHNFDMALRPVHPLMTRHFTEVGSWILAAKRLLEIAKTCLG